MKLISILITFLFIGLIFNTHAESACVCTCVNGRNVPICEKAIDLEPICPPRVCPILTPSVEPINPVRVPPIGTSDCRMVQIYNEHTGRYEWQQVCQ